MTYSIRDFRPGQRVWLDSIVRGPAWPAIVQRIGRTWLYLTVYHNGIPSDERARPEFVRPREEAQP